MRARASRFPTHVMAAVLIGIAIASLYLSIISLETMSVNVVTQSPFFLYGNPIYIVSIVVTLIITILLIRLRETYAIIPTLILWVLILVAPYAIYADSLPLYNDQLGFVEEALSGILLGHVTAIQGESTSLGHAYFTSIFTLITGLNPLTGVITVQYLLPILYALPLLAAKRRKNMDIVFIPLLVLASMLNPIIYGRTPFAWSYLVLLSIFLYNRITANNEQNINFSTNIIFMIIFAAYLISDPTSLIIPIILILITMFDRRFIWLAVLSTILWLATNVIFYLSPSLYSIIIQLEALIEQPSNPVPSLVAPAINPTMKLYDYIRELTVFLSFLVGLIASLAIVMNTLFRKRKNYRELAWTLIYFAMVALQAAALAMNRWGMVPHSIYVISALPALALIVGDNKWFRALAMAIAAVLIVLAPVVKWGFSPIAYPTANDVQEAVFIAKDIGPQTTICASGAHELLSFYYWLYNVSSPITYVNPLPTLSKDQISQCAYIAIFYRTLNTYRLDVSENQLMSIINSFDRSYDVIYKDSLWMIWSR